MDDERWGEVDRYIAGLLARSDPALDQALHAGAEEGMPVISITANQGKMLQVLARAVGARMILEVGTLAGYSAIWLARTLSEGGRLVTLESDPKHARVARRNIERAGLAEKVEVRLGPALELLPGMQAEGLGPFDFVFIDADKANTPAYFEWALKLTRPGSLVVCDNVIRGGTVTDAESGDPGVRAMRQFIEMLADEKRVVATVVQTVGEKDWDGFAVALVIG